MKRTKRPQFSAKALRQFLGEKGQPVRLKDFYGYFNASAPLKKTIRATLLALVQQGEILRAGKAYTLPEHLPRMHGVLDVRRSGVGYVRPENTGLQDVFIAPEHFGGAWPEDTVEIALTSSGKKNPEGMVLRVLQRARTEIAARSARPLSDGDWLCHPVDSRLPFDLVVNSLPKEAESIAKGDVLLVRVEKELSATLWRGTVQSILGGERDLNTQERLVKNIYTVPQEFPQAVLAAAAVLPAVPAMESEDLRRDLRALPLVTIDGENAKDFDDAVFVSRTTEGFRLVVAIADVAHYVPVGSALDIEARERANSWYFPCSVEPMLPESLSNGLCSLRPHEPRLSMVVDAIYSKEGAAFSTEFYPAIIQSQGRLTYTQVQACLDGQKDSTTAPHAAMLHDARALAEIFLQTRMARGCLDFDIPEPQISLNAQNQVQVQTRSRIFSQRLIEEFMIAANERVAEFLASKKQNFPYRVHPEPEEGRLQQLVAQLSRTVLANRLPAGTRLSDLQHIVQLARQENLEYLISRLVLRTMMQAQYAPENAGHYGLGSEAYCHFTSPIRRYADLLTHRALKNALRGETAALALETLEKICSGLNEKERKAMEAEREIQKRAAILALEDRVGEDMPAMISGLAEFGFWVELRDMPVDGLVRLALLDDYYLYDAQQNQLIGQHAGRVFRLGQEITVTLLEANLDRVELNFTLPEAQSGKRKTQALSRVKRRKRR